MRLAGRLAFQGPRNPRDQQGVGVGHAGQTARRPRPILGRSAGLQARGYRPASVLQLSGNYIHGVFFFFFF